MASPLHSCSNVTINRRDVQLSPLNLRRRHARAPSFREVLLAGGHTNSSSNMGPVATGVAVATAPTQQQWSDEDECIQVSDSFQAAEGAELADGLVISKHVGSGSTADVYKLKVTAGYSAVGSNDNSKGKQKELVLKVAKSVPGLQSAFKREWMLGRRLNAVARQVPELKCIIHTGPAVITKDQKGKVVFKGCVLEGINGKSLDKRLQDDDSFCDVDFIKLMLKQVLSALHKSQALVGFEHGDMRISNIMEHAPDPAAFEQLLQNPDSWRKAGFESAAGAAVAKGLLTFRILDFGHSTINDRRSHAYLVKDAKQDGSCGGLALGRLPRAKGFLEAFYSFWYKDKSDAWRLLRSLATRLDGRAWPQRRQADVLALYKLMEDVLDLKLQARFFQDVELSAEGNLRRMKSEEKVFDESSQQFVAIKEVAVLDMTAKPRRFKLLRAAREKLLRLWSRFFSRKPRVTAKEVLQKMTDLGLIED